MFALSIKGSSYERRRLRISYHFAIIRICKCGAFFGSRRIAGASGGDYLMGRPDHGSGGV